MKPTKTKRVLAKKSVSFPPELFKAATNRAKGLNRNFSNYLQTLVQADLGEKEEAKAA